VSNGVVLSISDLSAGYGKLTIIHNVSMDVRDGEIVCLVGANGSGKSTLLKSVLGITDIFKGSIYHRGEDITKLPTEMIAGQKIGYVPQRDNVFPNLTILENLEIGGVTLRDKEVVRNEITNVMDLFPQLKESKKKAKVLSGGQRQMLAIGRALIMQPQLLLLDEPTAALAPQVVNYVLGKVREIRDRGVTVLIVEQNAQEALRISDRGVVLASGEKVFEGNPQSISSNEEIVRLFLGITGDKN
jgi:ABC-type branched-subunit amino acid transport system ATPase component